MSANHRAGTAHPPEPLRQPGLFSAAREPILRVGGDRAADRVAAAAAALDELEQLVDHLWRSAVADGSPECEQLVDVSHALRRAAHLLDEHAIG